MATSRRQSRKSRISPTREASSHINVEAAETHLESLSSRTYRGLPRRTAFFNSQQKTQRSSEFYRQELVYFVKHNFKRKECKRFVPKHDPKKPDQTPIKCHCGEVPEKHMKGTVGVPEFFQHGVDATANDLTSGKMIEEWNPKKDILEFPTNAFGKIDFFTEGGRKPSKYVRIKDDTPVEEIVNLMLDKWRLNNPKQAHLVITVIGGAKNFKLDGKKKEIFNRGLISAAQTTNAWLITSGCNMGVMRAVGEAVAEGQSYNWDRTCITHTLRCIGIAPWGYVMSKEALVSNDDNGSWNALYKPSKVIRHGEPVSLNPDHTHFILVDDGYRGRYGGVAQLRANLERKISLPTNPTDGEDKGLGIPVVLVLVEGGFDAILDASNSIKARIPIVICEGTGRAADILAYAYTHYVTTRKGERVMKKKYKIILEDKLCAAFGKTWAQRSDERKEAAIYLNIVLECCQDENLITVFDMHKNEELDLSILSALLKGQGATNLDQIHDQLKLALTWNRSDVAEEKIFTLDINWPTGSLNDIMTTALKEDKVDFVRLLLQNGVAMEEYLTVPRLRALYNCAPKNCHLRELLMEQQKDPNLLGLRDVNRLLRKLMSKHSNDLYRKDSFDDRTAASSDVESIKNDEAFPKPFRELLLWAVLMNRHELAKYMWERGDDAIPSAIAASRLYGSMAGSLAHYDSDLKEQYNSNKHEFEQLAVKVLDECHNTDPEKAVMLVEKQYSAWGDQTCLDMAAAAHDMEFLSTVCCQNSLNLMWKSGITSSSAIVVFGLLLPFLILFRVRFQTVGDDNEQLSPWQKLLTFYRAPVTKFAGNVMMYILFLGIYSYMLLFAFRKEMTWVEYFVIAWMCTVLLEEIREMLFSSTGDTVKERLYNWWNFSVFNRIDLLIIVLAILGFIMRFGSGRLVFAKMVYSVNCIFLFIRLLRDYSASSYLGPKLVMISRMMVELVFFVMILVVFLLAYGISSQALMYIERDFYSLIFRDIFYYPYWQIYGELYLEEFEGRSGGCQGNDSSGLTDLGMPCPEFNWMVPCFTVAYMLIGNLLLLNILIATFNHVFNDIQANSIQIWKYGMYFLVVEYDTKPGLAPPFIIFEHIFLVIRWFVNKCCKKKETEVGANDEEISLLQVFQRECCKQYAKKQKNNEKAKMHQKIAFIQAKVDEMAKLLAEEKLLDQQHFEAEQNRGEGEGHPTPMPHNHHHHHPSPRRGSTDNPGPSLANIPADQGYGRSSLSRWPSLEKISMLKKQMELAAIREDSQNGAASEAENGSVGPPEKVTPDRSGHHDETGRGNNLPGPAGDKRRDPPQQRGGGDNEEDAYDTLKFGKTRQVWTRGQEDPTYDVMPDLKQLNVTKQSADSNSAVDDAHAARGDGGSERSQRKEKQRKNQTRKKNEEEDLAVGRAIARMTEPDSALSAGRSSRSGQKRKGRRVPVEAYEAHSTSNDEDGGDDADIYDGSRPYRRPGYGMSAASSRSPPTRAPSRGESVSAIEQRMAHLEQSTQSSLHNIESLLRNVVLHQASPHAGVSQPHPALAFDPALVPTHSVAMTASRGPYVPYGLLAQTPPPAYSRRTINHLDDLQPMM